MKKIILSFVFLVLPVTGFAATDVHLDDAKVDLSNKNSMQRGAKYFVNYCMGCHSLAYQRYNRLGQDLGLTDLEVEQNLIFTHDDDGVPTKVGSLMTIAMDKRYGKEAFGLPVPDLTLVARSRGSNWIYTYLHSFYLDENQAMGVNNPLIPNVAMPHALWELQGWQKPVYRIETDENGRSHEVIDKFELVEQGELSPEEYDQVVRDITNFLTYVAEPAQLVRYKIGVWVVLFLLMLTGIAYLLKKEYWKDIK